MKRRLGVESVTPTAARRKQMPPCPSVSVSTQKELDKLLETRSFGDLVAAGDLLSVGKAMAPLGYTSRWGLRWACIHGKVGHVKRGRQYYFLKSQLQSIPVTFVPPSAVRP